MKATRGPGHPGIAVRSLTVAAAVAAGIGIFAQTAGLFAQQAPAATAMCTITGTIDGLGGPLPGVSIMVRRGDTVQTATSSGLDGTFKLSVPDASYQLSAELTGFDRVQKDVTVNKADACAAHVDVTMSLAPKTTVAITPSRGRGAGPGTPPQNAAAAAAETAETAAGRRFESLAVQQNAATATLAASLVEQTDPSALMPAGFGSEAVADAFAVTGDAARVDRGLLNDRRDALNRGDFNLGNFDARNNEGGFGGNPNAQAFGGFNNNNQGGFQGNNNNNNGRGRGNNNNNNFSLGGRGGRQSRLQMSATYGFRGSALEAPRKQLRSDVPAQERPYTNHTYNFQLGGPLKLPGLYNNPNNSTTLTMTFSGNTGGSVFDQYATVPTDNLRAGDFSNVLAPLLDPATGQPFEGNVIPKERINPQAAALLAYYPAANLPGITRNYHYATTNFTRQNQVQARIQHNFSGQQAGNTGRGGGGGTRSNAGQAGQGRRLLGTRTNVNMNLNVQYQQQDSDQLNVFTTLGGQRTSRSYSIQDSFNVQHGRAQHQFGVTYNNSRSETNNRFGGNFNISNMLGIEGVSPDPFAWGLPRLSFSSISGLSDVNPNLSNADRLSTQYTLRHPVGRNHQIQLGGDYRWDVTRAHTESNPNGSFVYSGLYTSGGSNLNVRSNGFDFADFLLGMPAQATIAYGPGETALTGRTLGVFIQDDWKMRSNLTVQLGVRWDLLWPFTEANGHMVNLDVTPDFTAAAPVQSGETGEFTGEFPKALIKTDYTNVQPKLGIAWRGPHEFILRGSYETAYNNNTYSGIARQLSQQPPFATTGTNIGSIQSALLMQNALTGISKSDVTNNFGIDKDYVFGLVQTAAINVQRQMFQTWQVGLQYTYTRGSSLDIVRAPNRDATGLRIDGVQAFNWTSSEGNSVLNSGNFQVQKQLSRGVSFRVGYTIAKSRDNSPSIGGGGSSSVAQNDQDIEAEWGLSNFDRRHALEVSGSIELPFGANRRFLYNGGVLAAIAEGWQLSPNFSAQSGQPRSIIVRGAAGDINSGLNGALRANYNGEPVTVDDPTINRWFNTGAFSIPAVGAFGTSPRNVVFGPGTKNFNMSIQRTVRMGGNRSLRVQMSITDILNMTNYSGIDTNVNSVTFGQITSVTGNRTANLNFRLGF